MNPGSTMRLGNCALVPGQHTVTFANVTLQTNAFIETLGNENYYTQLLFIRTDQGKVTIQNYAPSIFNCNYLMYRNADDNKFYYAFVVQVVYVNENVCDVYFEIDPLQTYMFDYTRNACMVIREHTNDDTIGANIMDEPVGTGELKILQRTMLNHRFDPDHALDEYYAFAFTAQEPDGSYSKGGTLDGCYTGGGVYYAPVDPLWTSPGDPPKPLVPSPLGDWLDSMSSHQGSIATILLFPKVLCNALESNVYDALPVFKDEVNGGYVVNTNEMQYMPLTPPRDTIDGYTPRNKKLFTYPFCFERVTNNKGQYHDYRWEFFGITAEVGTYAFRIKGTLNPAGDIFCSPVNYNGQWPNMTDKISLGGLIQVPWAYNSFTNWMGANGASVAMNLLSGAAMLIPGAGMAAGAVRAGLGQAASAAGRVAGLRAAGSVAGTRNAGSFVRSELAQTFSTTQGQFALTGAAMGANTVGSAVANIIDQHNRAGHIEGGYSNNSLSGLEANTFTFLSLGVRAEFAAMIDDYFDQYGYATNAIKTPNETGRASWNYVQTSGACFTGDVPAPYMREINAMYDAGITFWHDLSYVGDYNRDNSIV